LLACHPRWLAQPPQAQQRGLASCFAAVATGSVDLAVEVLGVTTAAAAAAAVVPPVPFDLFCCIHPLTVTLMGDHEAAELERPEKRQRLDEQQAARQQQQAGDDDAAPPAPPPAHDQISAALTKIRHHLGNKNKFSKASQLLRQLLDAVDKVIMW
jgi:hypothetical protein